MSSAGLMKRLMIVILIVMVQGLGTLHAYPGTEFQRFLDQLQISALRNERLPTPDEWKERLRGTFFDLLTDDYSPADPNSQCLRAGSTALHWASQMGDIEMIQLLLAKRADPNILNMALKSPLAYAKDDETKQILLGAGAIYMEFGKLMRLLSNELFEGFRNSQPERKFHDPFTWHTFQGPVLLFSDEK